MANTKAFFLVAALVFTIVVPLHAHAHAQLYQVHPKVDAIYQFGDSISDAGNLIRDNPIGEHSNFGRLPYGQTYSNTATGRCSDGLLMIDFFAKYFNLPLLFPYLYKEGNFTNGVNFAVAGSTALPTSILGAKNILSPITNSSLSIQLSWFKSHLKSICSDSSDCKSKLSKALFIIETGGNDLNYAFFQGQTMQEVYDMVPEVIEAIKSAVEEVISLGATRVVVPGNFPIGCMPIYLASFLTNDVTSYDTLHCLKDLNEFATYQNIRLQQALKEVQLDHPNVKVVYADYFLALEELLQHAAYHGFDPLTTQKACCGMGNNAYNFNMTTMCGNPNVTVCNYPYKSVSWDGVHMTQHAYRVLADWLLKFNILPGISH